MIRTGLDMLQEDLILTKDGIHHQWHNTTQRGGEIDKMCFIPKNLYPPFVSKMSNRFPNISQTFDVLIKS